MILFVFGINTAVTAQEIQYESATGRCYIIQKQKITNWVNLQNAQGQIYAKPVTSTRERKVYVNCSNTVGESNRSSNSYNYYTSQYGQNKPQTQPQKVVIINNTTYRNYPRYQRAKPRVGEVIVGTLLGAAVIGSVVSDNSYYHNRPLRATKRALQTVQYLRGGTGYGLSNPVNASLATGGQFMSYLMD